MRGSVSRFQVADVTGAILKAGSPGRGLRLVPGTPNVKSGSNPNALLVPGSFPVRVRFRDGKQAGFFDVVNSDAHYFSEEFGDFDVIDCDAGDSWCVYVYETREDGSMPTGNKTVVPVRLAAGVAVQNGGVPAGSVGFPLRPGMLAVTTYVLAGGVVNTLWVRKLDGAWFNTLETFDATGANQQYDSRVIATPGDRFIWVGAGAGETIDVEAKYEAG